jgi:hypothetical protein
MNDRLRKGTAVCHAPIERLIPNQLVSALSGLSRAAQNCMSLIPKIKTSAESRLRCISKNDSNSFILNNLAERVGFGARLPNEINKLGGANGRSNLHSSTKTINSTLYWTLNGRWFPLWSYFCFDVSINGVEQSLTSEYALRARYP